ncbi:MAG: FHA domain-containing protein [Planctomycetes bacterium]|nr:FHA domain-containing protein [Planctomycetota bacterium]
MTIENGAEQGKRILLKDLSVFEAGRSPGNHVCLKDPSVAMSHFRVYRKGDDFSVYDLGTKRGTLLNGTPVEKGPLSPGDRLQVGDVVLTFDLVDEATPGRIASSAPDSDERDAQAMNGGVLTKTRASIPSLVVIDGQDRGKHLALVGKEQFRVGRSVASDLKLVDGKISRDHCMVEAVRDQFIIIDLESANGTVVNGERVRKTVLKEGDMIRLGYTMLKYDRV